MGPPHGWGCCLPSSESQAHRPYSIGHIWVAFNSRRPEGPLGTTQALGARVRSNGGNVFEELEAGIEKWMEINRQLGRGEGIPVEAPGLQCKRNFLSRAREEQ